MKKLILALLFFVSTSALAEDMNAAPSAPPAAAAEQDKMMDPAKRQEKFEERKAKMLQHMSERMSDMQKKQACVQAATTPEAMKSCFPKWEERMKNKGQGGEHKPDNAPERQ